ncbi:MAG: formylglycine-generating enzyme family protein [Myxococcota bacterium]
MTKAMDIACRTILLAALCWVSLFIGCKDSDRGANHETEGAEQTVEAKESAVSGESGVSDREVEPTGSSGSNVDELEELTSNECGPGQINNQYTQGHCCWPGQAWSSKKRTCLGEPTTCPKDAVRIGADCAFEPECLGGQTRASDGFHCCWPGQGWSSKQLQCVGDPKSCPGDWVASSEGCAPKETPDGYAAIPAGTFTMGSPAWERGHERDEQLHEVTISRPFWLKKTEVTWREWAAVVGEPRWVEDSYMPFEPRKMANMLSWYDAVAYLNKLSEKQGLETCYELGGCSGEIGGVCLPEGGHEYGEPCDEDFTCETVKFKGLSCEGYRLPTEAEWEYAARAGSPGPRYAELDVMVERGGGWETLEDSAGEQPNAWGLSNVFGGVWEWTNDWYGAYPEGDVTDPVGPSSGSLRVRRGPANANDDLDTRAAERSGYPADFRGPDNMGFRPARTMERR